VFGEILCGVISERRKPALLFHQIGQTGALKMIWQKKVFDVSIAQAKRVISTLSRDGLFSDLAHEDDVIEIWSIGDTTLPLHDLSINRIVITSPGEARVGHFADDLKLWIKANSPLTLVVPPCTWEEMLNIRLAWGENAQCSIDTLRERFELWGGVPRNIIGSQYLSSSCADQEFKYLTIADAVRCIVHYDLDRRPRSGKLFHLLPAFRLPREHQTLSLEDRYNANNAVYYWASEQMESKAWMKYRHENESAVLDFITTLNNSPYRPREGVGRENT